MKKRILKITLPKEIVNRLENVRKNENTTKSKVIEKILSKCLRVPIKQKPRCILNESKFKLLNVLNSFEGFTFYISMLERMCISGKIDLNSRSISRIIPSLVMLDYIEEVENLDSKNKSIKYYKVSKKGKLLCKKYN